MYIIQQLTGAQDVGPVISSKLSKDVKNAESIYSFRKKICKEILNK